jgi:hypothetical protein
MSITHERRIAQLESRIRFLRQSIVDLQKNIKEKLANPYSSGKRGLDRSQIRTSDIKTGFGHYHGGNLPWNDKELALPPYNTQPSTPTIGFNKHSHSRYSGGALDIRTLELVEFENDGTEEVGNPEKPVILDRYGNSVNKHCQQFWGTVDIKQMEDSDGNLVDKIGFLDIAFDPDTRKWITGSNIIDVDGTDIVQYVWRYSDAVEAAPGASGATKTSEIKRDSKGVEMKAPLRRFLEEGEFGLSTAARNSWNNGANVYWDEIAGCFRFYAIFRPYPEES